LEVGAVRADLDFFSLELLSTRERERREHDA
jgi:hypothetical protein